ncbi:MAG: hypothetical protein WD267_10170 [Balneolales bacterium]
MKITLTLLTLVLCQISYAQTGNRTIDKYVPQVITHIGESAVYVNAKSFQNLRKDEVIALHQAIEDYTGLSLPFLDNATRPDYLQPLGKPLNPYARPKDPGTAALLSVLVTGGGHMYAGEVGKGLLLLAGGVASTAIGVSVWADNLENDLEASTTPLWIGVAGSVTMWIVGIANSESAVINYNERHGFKPTVEPSFQSVNEANYVGAKLTFHF